MNGRLGRIISPNKPFNVKVCGISAFKTPYLLNYYHNRICTTSLITRDVGVVMQDGRDNRRGISISKSNGRVTPHAAFLDAVENGDAEKVAQIFQENPFIAIDHVARPDAVSVLHIAVRAGDVAMTNTLIKLGANVNITTVMGSVR